MAHFYHRALHWITLVLTAGGRTVTNKLWQVWDINQTRLIGKDGDLIPFKKLKNGYDLWSSGHLHLGLSDDLYDLYHIKQTKQNG